MVSLSRPHIVIKHLPKIIFDTFVHAISCFVAVLLLARALFTFLVVLGVCIFRFAKMEGVNPEETGTAEYSQSALNATTQDAPETAAPRS